MGKRKMMQESENEISQVSQQRSPECGILISLVDKLRLNPYPN